MHTTTRTCATEVEFFEVTRDLGGICELVGGELRIMSRASRRHDDIRGFLSALLRLYLERRPLGSVHGEPYSMRLGADRIREPDIFYVAAERRHLLGELFVDGAADLVIEVVSDTASSRARDLQEKRDEYARCGVAEYWAIDASRGVILAFAADDEYAGREVREGRLESAACPGFWIEASWVLTEPTAGVLEAARALLGAL